VENFKYLWVILNEDNNNKIDLQERLKNANKIYFMLQKFCVNIRIRNWDINKERKKAIERFWKESVRRILGPVYDNEKENWTILNNKEIYASVKKSAIIDNKVK